MGSSPLIGAGASTILGMAGAQSEAAGKEAAFKYNAAMKERQATATIAQAQEDERRQRVEGTQAIGSIRAAVGASGVQLEGSALDVLESSAANAERDSLTVRHQGQMKAWALKSGASLDLYQGNQAVEAGKWASAGALLNGGTKIAGMV